MAVHEAGENVNLLVVNTDKGLWLSNFRILVDTFNFKFAATEFQRHFRSERFMFSI